MQLWFLPQWVPFAPSNFWCHCRMVYLPMGYIYGHRVTSKITPLIKELRSELYTIVRASSLCSFSAVPLAFCVAVRRSDCVVWLCMQPWHQHKWTNYRFRVSIKIAPGQCIAFVP